MERRPTRIVEPIAGIERQELQFRAVGQVRRFVDDKSPRVDTSPNGHAEQRSTGRAAQQALHPTSRACGIRDEEPPSIK